MKRFPVLLSCIAALAVSFSAFGDIKPDHLSLKLGAFEITAISDTSFELDAKLIKNGDPKTIAELLPAGRQRVPANAYLIRSGRHLTLIDAGIGRSKMGTGTLLRELAACGVQPKDIDTVLVTHAHFDHIGGLLDGVKPVFTSAAVYISAKEIAAFDDKALAALPADVKPYFVPGNNVIKSYADKIKPFKPGAAVAEGITSVDLSGHTPGHTGYLIESEGKKFFMAGDLLHIGPVQFAHPEYSLIYDANVPAAAAVRKTTMDRLAGESLLFAGSHIEFPGIGTIKKSGNGFVFTPMKK